MALKGNVRDFNLEEILRFLNVGKKTGALIVEKGSDSVTFYFEKGNLYFVNRVPESYSFTERVLSSGILPQSLVQKIKEGKAYPPKEIDLDENNLKDVEKLLIGYLTEISSDVLSWPEGSFIFQPGDKKTGENWGININIEVFIEKAKKRGEVYSKFNSYAKDIDVPLFLKKDIKHDEDIILTGKEWNFLCSVKSGMNIKEISKDLSIPISSALKIAISLIEKGLIKVEKEKSKDKFKNIKVKKETGKVEEIEKEEEKTKSDNKTEKEPEEKSEKEISEEGSLIDELAAITGKVEPGKIEVSDETKKELRDILDSLKDL